jgi:peptide-methionine (S)-S-oxide reductase
METATFAAGCFWGVEAAFRRVPGVAETVVGYMGGNVDNPDYKQVCSGRTGHAEVVQVVFDPAKVTYSQLLEVFWAKHDPTALNRQGMDIGTQYRSAIFYHSPLQQTRALASKQAEDASGRLPRRIVTQVTAAGPFWKAEDDHQRFLEKRGRAGGPLPASGQPAVRR